MTDYKVVNPFIEGSFKNLFSGNSEIEAARNAWNALSQHFYNNLPRFAFTLEKVSDGTLSHFVVEESVKGNSINFKLDQVNLDDPRLEDKFRTELKNARENKSMSGGAPARKRYKDQDIDDDDDDDDDDEDDSDIYDRIRMEKMRMRNKEIIYWRYIPNLYQKYIDSIYVPSFIELTPYVEIQLLPTYSR